MNIRFQWPPAFDYIRLPEFAAEGHTPSYIRAMAKGPPSYTDHALYLGVLEISWRTKLDAMTRLWKYLRELWFQIKFVDRHGRRK